MKNSEGTDEFTFCDLLKVEFSIKVFVVTKEWMKVNNVETKGFYLVVQCLSRNKNFFTHETFFNFSDA